MDTATKVFIAIAALAALGFVGRLIQLFRQSRAIEKTLDYSKMREWEDDDDDWRQEAGQSGSKEKTGADS